MAWPPTTHQDVQDAITALQAGRATVQKVSGSLAATASEQSTIQLTSAALIYRVVADKACRVRLYTTAAKQAADLNRAIGTDPTNDHGCTLDVVLTASMLSLDVSPMALATDLKVTPDGLVPITITNRDTTTGTVSVTLTYKKVE